ncbi:MAG TPA: RusA family crossover junction endodeoxyribonuclease [Pseudogracilibacillus sp.]|nr:RusA family crossover junction endodeoxyribonuclease [Pseudogracilibacillus sp.]
MFETHYKGRPRPAERPRARFSSDSRTYYLYNPPSYQKYKAGLTEFFNQFSDDKNLQELFNPKELVYGLSLKLIFRLKGKGKKPFYGKRPDIDNLFKAVADSLFESNVNLIEDGIEQDKEGNTVTDAYGNPLTKYRQQIDDSRIIHTEMLKLRVDSEEEEGIKIVIRNVGKEEIS